MENVVILKMDALSFDPTNQAYVWMMDDSGELQQVNVEVGINNGSYVEIRSGLSDGDTVYVEAQEEETATGLLSLFSGLQRNQFNAERGNRGNWNRENAGNNGGMPGGPGSNASGGSGGSFPGGPGGN